jgi:hypothetical protein
MNFAPECTSPWACGPRAAPNYTFRSMPRSLTSRAQPEQARETSRPTRVRKATSAPVWTKRLTKRVVPKADGRYLIYYEKS